MENVLVFVAHPDDQVLGMGGTIAKYSRQGKRVIVVIFSYGEVSIPLLRERIIIKERLEETEKVDKLLGIKKTIFMGIADSKIRKSTKNREVIERVRSIIEKYKPKKIFTHSSDDFHIGGDHMGVWKIVVRALRGVKDKPNLYTFDVWNITSLIRSNRAKMYIDVTETFQLKLRALKLFKSQWMYIQPLMPTVLSKAAINGKAIDKRYAEKFYQIR